MPTQSKSTSKLNKVNMKLLLAGLDPKRHDIVVTKTAKNKITNWRVKNTQGVEIFSLQNEEIRHLDGRYDEYSHLWTLKINGICTVVDSEDYGDAWNTVNFIQTDLQNALETKLKAQNEEKIMQAALQTMSAQDKMIQKYLEQTLQR